VDLLANSLPAQSSYFIQVSLVFTFLFQGFDLVRAYPLGLAFLRNSCCGPRLTTKERRQTWNFFNSLEDPPEFWHAEILAQIMLLFVVSFVYSVIAPITSFFLCGCFVICESGYRYHFIHNNHTSPDSGGRLWQAFIRVLMASMLIAQFTLVGLLILKKTVYAVAALAPLIALTILFMIFVIPKRNHVANHLPTLLCVETDKQNADEENGIACFSNDEYLQPSLRAHPINAEVSD
jgi:calcium permeable stress-gated cation channel